MAEALILSAATGAAKGILDGLLSLAKDQIKDQVKLACGFKEDLGKLCEKLEMIQALFHDAENHKIRLQTMLVWLKRLKAATSEAENVLDELAYEARRREVQNCIRNKVSDMFTLSNPLFFRFKMANKVNNINMLLNDIYKAAIDVGLKPAEQVIGPIVEPSYREFRLTGPSIEERKVVGRDVDVSKVMNMLLGFEIGSDLPVIAIVGMPGLGKTTLAQIVYNKPEVMEYFCEKSDKGVKIDKRMWICVSENFKVDRLLNEMVESLSGEKSDLQNRQALLKKLGKELNGKKYLLVLDDVWNTDSNLWVSLRNALIGIGGSKESKILVTTRSMEVVSATQTSPSCIHLLTQLSKDDCWKMFKKRAFAIGGPQATRTLLEVGKRLVAKCKGVPLAVNSLGGLLYSKKDEREWELIENNEIWSLLDHNNGILPILRLSFDQLPSPSLKQCFAYCSIFPKDKVIVKDELIQLWMGLGYLRSPSRSQGEMEELGNEYFKILWHNSLFQEVEFDDYNNITTCKMHDLVHDLALHVSQDNCLILEASVMKYNPDGQHLSLDLTKQKWLDMSKENVGKLRTLFLKGHLPQSTHDFKCLRALRLEEDSTKEESDSYSDSVEEESDSLKKESSIEELPSLIRKSIHLRFLDLTETSIMKIPNYISKLYNLETLKLPRSPNELPKDFHKLVSLRHFYIENSVENRKLMPMNIGQLTSLQTLPFFVVGKKSGHRIEELGSLSKLRGRLRIYGLQNVEDKDAAKKAKVIEKQGIQELRLEWDEVFDDNHEGVLEGLEPHKNVKALELVKFGGRRWPSWMSRNDHSLQNLVKIKLEDCKLCEQVPALGHLQHLAHLEMMSLHSLKSIGHEFYGAEAKGVFPALIDFKLDDMPQLEEWLDVLSSPAAAVSTMEFFPRLQELQISRCTNLKTLPAFKDSTSFRRLLIFECSELTCLPKVVLQPSLEVIMLQLCPKLKSLNPINEAAFNVCTSFRQLFISCCQELRCLPERLLQPNLVALDIEYCPKLETPKNPDALCSLTSLKFMRIKSCCPSWGSCWEEGLFCTTSLERLIIGDFREEYRHFPWPSTSGTALSSPSSHFTSLESLVLYGWPEVKSLPDQLEHLPALRELEIWGFSGLESLPDWLGNLKSLESLSIRSCPLVEKRCEKGIGEDWHKIAHIPNIKTAYRRIQ